MMGRYSMFTDADLALALRATEEAMGSEHFQAFGADFKQRCRENCQELRAEMARRADRIIVKHIGRSTWQGTQSEWEKRV